MATPRSAPPGADRMTLASARVARRTFQAFMRLSPAPSTPRMPAVPKDSCV